MLIRRALAKFVGAAALAGGMPLALPEGPSRKAPLRPGRAEPTSSRMAGW